MNEKETDGTEVMLNLILMSCEIAVCKAYRSTRTPFNTVLCWISHGIYHVRLFFRESKAFFLVSRLI